MNFTSQISKILKTCHTVGSVLTMVKATCQACYNVSDLAVWRCSQTQAGGEVSGPEWKRHWDFLKHRNAIAISPPVSKRGISTLVNGIPLIIYKQKDKTRGFFYPLRGVRSCPNTLSVKTCSLSLDLSKGSYTGQIPLFFKIKGRKETIYCDMECFFCF